MEKGEWAVIVTSPYQQAPNKGSGSGISTGRPKKATKDHSVFLFSGGFLVWGF